MSSPIPRKWKQFLCLNDNKTELFKLLIAIIATAGKSLVVTNGNTALCVPARDMTNFAPCNHEEADSRIIIHVADAIMLGFQKIPVLTVDTDVVVLAVAVLPQLRKAQLWIAFGTGKNFRYLSAHEICASLSPQKLVVLTMFHAFIGCDTVSQFAQLGQTAWKVWATHDEFTATFLWAAQFTTANIWSDRSFIGVFHYPSLWQDSNMYLYQWSLKASIHTQRLSDVSSSSHQGCSTATYN